MKLNFWPGSSGSAARARQGLSYPTAALSQTEGKILIDIMNDHGLEQQVHFPTRVKTHWI